MADRPERQRIGPTVEGRASLLAAIDVAGPVHVVEAGTLGEYAELVVMRGPTQAAAAFPEVALHLADGCTRCETDLGELVALLAEPDEDETPGLEHRAAFTEPRDTARPEHWAARVPDEDAARPIRESSLDDSGIYAVDLPDPRRDEAAEAARLQRLRRLRDLLLFGAAAAILLIGLSLVGLAYVASRSPGVRVDLLPLPATAPASSSGRAEPTGTSCPIEYPIKGNRASMIYHPPGGAFYDQTRPEACFAGPADAEAAGYRRSQR